MRRMSAFEISYWSTRYRRTLLGRPDFGTFEAILQHRDVALQRVTLRVRSGLQVPSDPGRT